MNTGFQLKPIEDDHYVFGDAKLGDVPILTDGQWDSWLPIAEDQAPFGFEPMACTTFALLNAVEIMLRQRYGATNNFSKKFLAYVSGTTTSGNDPHTVAEALRTKGDVEESDYPYVSTDTTWAKFYAQPAQWLYTKALEFIAQYSFGHSWVSPASPGSMMSALNYSPLTAGVYAWLQEDPATGYYTNKLNLSPEHDVCIYGYVVNEYWKCFDSYSLETKKLAWDMPFSGVKRYTLNRQVVNPTAWDTFIQWMNTVLEGMKAKLGLGYFGDRTFGVARSPEFAQLSRDMIKEAGGLCRMGLHKPTLLNPLNTHHVVPFHKDKSKELEKTNLVVLCRFHHFLHAHLKNWASFNVDIVADCDALNSKIKTRP